MNLSMIVLVFAVGRMTTIVRTIMRAIMGMTMAMIVGLDVLTHDPAYTAATLFITVTVGMSMFVPLSFPVPVTTLM
jgi:hypothetical protein